MTPAFMVCMAFQAHRCAFISFPRLTEFKVMKMNGEDSICCAKSLFLELPGRGVKTTSMLSFSSIETIPNMRSVIPAKANPTLGN